MKKDIKMYGIPSHQLDYVWPDLAPYLQKAIDYSDGKYGINDVYKSLAIRDMQLWVAYSKNGFHACCVTQIIKFPLKKVMMLVFIAGKNSGDWLHFVKDLKRFAKEHGCNSLEGYGRPGWEKLCKKLGFKKIHTVFKFDI